MQQIDKPLLSLDAPYQIDDDDSLTLLDSLEGISDMQQESDASELSCDIQQALDQLPERQADVIRRRYGFAPYEKPQTFETIAHDYGKTKQRMQQLATQGERKLKWLLRPLAKEEELVS